MCNILLSFSKGVFYHRSYLRGGMKTCVCRLVQSRNLSEKRQEDEHCSFPWWCGAFLNRSKTTKNESVRSYTILFRLNGHLVPESTMAVKQISESGKGCLLMNIPMCLRVLSLKIFFLTFRSRVPLFQAAADFHSLLCSIKNFCNLSQ